MYDDYWLIPKDTPCNFAQQFADVKPEVAAIMQHVDSRVTCIQAGGSIGLWALEYAKYFQEVVTYEPDPVSFAALLHNITGEDRIKIAAHKCALSSYEGGGMLVHPEPGRLTCGYLSKRVGPVRVERIDSYFSEHNPISLIHLDIEGGEHDALLGAARTLETWSPVVVVEHHSLPHLPHANWRVRDLLIAHGYKLATTYRWQQIFKKRT